MATKRSFQPHVNLRPLAASIRMGPEAHSLQLGQVEAVGYAPKRLSFVAKYPLGSTHQGSTVSHQPWS